MIPFEDADARLLPGFQRRFITVDGNKVLVLTTGEGPPVLMLHGDPQTHLCWHLIAPELAKAHTVVLSDLRGRGETHVAEIDQHGRAYAKRAQAAEQVMVMQALGHDKFAVVGHDRGARVARRIALDHPERATHLAVLDIVPALDLYESYSADIAQDYFYFNFLTQPAPLAERLISGDAERFMREILFGLPGAQPRYDAEALDIYLRSSTRQPQIAAMCACFRAGFHIDRADDVADRAAQRKIACPTLVAWGENSAIGVHFDVQKVWRGWVKDPSFLSLPCGHFVPEEAPQQTLQALQRLLATRAAVA